MAPSINLNLQMLYMLIEYFKEHNLMETARSLERESGYFFDMKYFHDMVKDGMLNEAEHYLSGFIPVFENIGSLKIFFELRKQKLLEALDRKDLVKASEIISKELSEFKRYHPKLLDDAKTLLTMDNFRKHGALSNYGDPAAERVFLAEVLKNYIVENPVFRGKFMTPGAPGNSILVNLLTNGGASSSTNADPVSAAHIVYLDGIN